MLYFKPIDNFGTSLPLIVLNWDEFNMPYIVDCPQLVEFNCKTFASFTKNGVNDIENTYGPVNRFLATLDIKDQEIIANAFVAMNLEILKSPKLDQGSKLHEVIKLEDTLGNILVLLDDHVNLCERIHDYVKQHIPVSDMMGAGTEPQHTREMTFYQDEAYLVTAMAVLMKLLSPVFGAFIYKYAEVLPTEHKEEHALSITTPLFKKQYHEIMLKLINYLKTLLEKNIKTDVTAAFYGQTLETATKLLLATIIVKRFVGVDLYKDEGNVIRYIASCANKGLESYQKVNAPGKGVKIITDPASNVENEEGNASRMESESSQSSRTADTPVIIKVATNFFCETLIQKENIDRGALDAVIAFYNSNEITISPIVIYTLCSYYGQAIGGGNGILLLRYPEIVKLISILQLLAMRDGIYNLAHALSFKISEEDRNQKPEDYVFLNSWRSKPEFADCKKVFPSGFGEKDWHALLTQISEYLVKKKIMYNTAPLLWDMIGQEIKNNSVFTNYIDLMVELMRFVRLIFQGNLLTIEEE